MEAAGVGSVTEAQPSAAVMDPLWGGGARECCDLCPGLGGEAVPPQAAFWGVLALASSKEEHAVLVGHSRVAHQSGGARPEGITTESGVSRKENTKQYLESTVSCGPPSSCDSGGGTS